MQHRLLQKLLPEPSLCIWPQGGLARIPALLSGYGDFGKVTSYITARSTPQRGRRGFAEHRPVLLGEPTGLREPVPSGDV